MDFNVTITLRLEDALRDLIERKMPDINTRCERLVKRAVKTEMLGGAEVIVSSATAPTPAPVEEEAAIEPDPAPVVEPNPEPIEIPAEQPAPEPTPVPEAAPALKTKKQLEMEVREIIHETRQRFEGEDYLVNPKGERRQRFHTPVANALKLIAVSLGYEKPTAIDTPEMVEAFRARAEELEINGNGDIAAPKAPY